jgi:hypothetical protein
MTKLFLQLGHLIKIMIFLSSTKTARPHNPGGPFYGLRYPQGRQT